MYAVIRTGGKQYRVAPGDVLVVDRLAVEPGSNVSFEPLAVIDESGVRTGRPAVDGAEVRAEVVAHGRGPKIRVFNYHAKTGWKKTRGHRSEQTRLKIVEIV